MGRSFLRSRLGKQSRPRLPVRSLLVTVCFLSLGLIFVTVLNYRTAVQVAEETLRNQGLSLSLQLAAEARSLRSHDAPGLQELVDAQHRRDLAFLVITDQDGTILAHSNPRLQGTRLEDSTLQGVARTGQLAGHLVTLGTGEEVYEVTVPFHVPPPGMSGPWQPRYRILRLALHTAPARQMVHHAVIQVVLVAVMVLVLLGVTGWQIRTLREHLRLHEEAARQKHLAALGSMAAVLAHEIRNPLGAIKGLAQFLAERAESTQAEMTETIAREATRLERLVNDLLTYARPRPPTREPNDLRKLLEEALALVHPLATAQGVRLQCEGPDQEVRVFVDGEQTKQVVSNLALNALQAMPRGGTLMISMRVAHPENEQVEVRVTDSGSGIVEADLPKVFDPFYTTRTKGTGLGLAICRQIVEAHAGTIAVERTGTTGTTILVTLPRETPDHA